MNDTPRGDRLHISFFGRRNVGKSSLINALTGQQVAIVSALPGTTTDPVYKSMEFQALGPVVFIDTPGIDDEGSLGELRIEKTKEVLRKTDLGILVITGQQHWGAPESKLCQELQTRKIPLLVVMNKWDETPEPRGLPDDFEAAKVPFIKTSAVTGAGIEALFAELLRVKKAEDQRMHLVDGIVEPGNLVVLVTPLDSGAPKGRLILPQQQVLRDILDHDALALVVKETDLALALKQLSFLPALVITDSQVFDQVNTVVPAQVPLTSFSIIYARQKGDLALFYQAVEAVQNLNDGDRLLVAEGCTHHRKDDDIGTVKIPQLLREKTGKRLDFHHVAGGYFAEDLSQYKMVIHCGACMLNQREMEYRQIFAVENGVPMVNYGIILAYVHGILDRALQPFAKELKRTKEER